MEGDDIIMLVERPKNLLHNIKRRRGNHRVVGVENTQGVSLGKVAGQVNGIVGHIDSRKILRENVASPLALLLPYCNAYYIAPRS